jgi:DNA repair protein RecN (Recombination protein N)
MLKTLLVENYALIEKITVQLPDGFSVITGETGAGKSILLGALNLMLGQRADARSVKDPDKKCVVEGLFDISSYHLKPFFDKHELDYDNDCIIRREVTPNGKSRSFINDTPVNIALLKELGEKLIDIHSQHENLLLNNSKFQLNIVDTMAGTKEELRNYQQLYEHFREDKKRLEQLIAETETRENDRDYIEFQLQQLEETRLIPDEQETLEEEISMLSHSEEIKMSLSKTLWFLSESDENINKNLKEGVNTLQSLSSIYPAVGDIVQRLDSCLIELKDISREIDTMQNDIEVNPQMLEQLNERLDLIYSLLKKHNVTSIPELLALQKVMEERIEYLEANRNEIDRLKADIENQESRLYELARKLSLKREKETAGIETQVLGLLRELGMTNARFLIEFSEKSNLSADGIDDVRFLFSANKDRGMQPLATIASGGEISRVMLSLKSVLSKTSGLPTIILDEIDTGVSGEIANKMGNIMQQMANFMQVISITHLPQIACKGMAHYKVYKTDRDEVTSSAIRQLTREERVKEIALMLSGSSLTPVAIQNAEELLQSGCPMK